MAAIPHKRPLRARAVDQRGLPVYICEYHDEALRCLHHAIRRRRLPFDGLTLVHLDAHPDLSASAVMPADTVFQDPREVYTALRSDAGGIAQWILPAVYGGHLRCVWWLRPEWAEQIADGVYDVVVGRAPRLFEETRQCAGECKGTAGHSAQPQVGAVLRRGRDAASTSLLATAVLSPPVAAHASLAAAVANAAPAAQHPDQLKNEGGGQRSISVQGAAAMPDTIHISCKEPYFVEDGTYRAASQQEAQKPLKLVVSVLPGATATLPVQGGESVPRMGDPWILDVCLDYFACGNPFLSQVRPHIASAFANVQNRAGFRQGPVEDVSEFYSQRESFDAAYNGLLRHHLAELALGARDDKGSNCDSGEEDADDEADSVGHSLLNTLAAFLPTDSQESLIQGLEAALAAAREGELREVLEAGDMITLPLHRPTADGKAEVYARLSNFEAFLTRLVGEDGLGAPPSAVTLARSVADGFCPMRWLCELEQGVVAAVQRQLGPVDIVYSDELDLLEYR